MKTLLEFLKPLEAWQRFVLVSLLLLWVFITIWTGICQVTGSATEATAIEHGLEQRCVRTYGDHWETIWVKPTTMEAPAK